MIRLRAVAGKFIINNAISAFENVARNLDAGIAQLQLEMDNHYKGIMKHDTEIDKHKSLITDLDESIKRACRVKEKVKALVE